MKFVHFVSFALSLAALGAFIPCTCSAADAPDLLQDQSKQKAALADLSAAQQELKPLFGHGEAFSDDAKRAELAPKVIPLLKRIVGVYDTLQVHALRSGQSVEFKFQPLAMLAYFGDENTVSQLRDNAMSKDQGLAVEAGAATTLAGWWKGAHDAAAQQKVLDSFTLLARDHANDDQLAIALMMMANMNPATPELRDSAMKIMIDELKGPFAQRLGQSIKSEMTLKTLEGKPLVLAAKSLDGTDFSSAKWKGKVILVDFWASWCGPCKAELTRVKKVYADYHDKGLEVLGISCDNGAGPLHKFLDENPDMTWPQLFDTANPGWHPLATGLGIRGIPTMFLIDKNGIVRTVSARQNFEELIPKMLEEKEAGK